MEGTRIGALAAAAAVVLLACGLACGPVPVDDATALLEVAGSTAPSISHGWPTSASPSSNALAALPNKLPGLDPQRIALGRTLFSDPRLSGDGLVACSHCHVLELGGANGQRKSTLPNRRPVPVNVPSIFNLAFDFRYSWNGRFETLEDQLDFTLGAPAAMGNTWPKVVGALENDAAISATFRQAYADGLNAQNTRDALVTYVRSLITPNARFDRFLRGELELSTQEARGYGMFRDYGCVSCHQGVNVGGNMFQRFGIMFDYFAERGAVEPADMGRYAKTNDEKDRHVFRVPSLRNVAMTAPYFHDGSSATLREAITTMGRYQLGRELRAEDTADIEAFLRTLTGELEGRPL